MTTRRRSWRRCARCGRRWHPETGKRRRRPARLGCSTHSLEYLEKRLAQIQYATFAAQGYPLGSGSVESANKLVVEARLKGAGMRWARAHVNPLVALRTVACSDRWDEAWPQITAQWRAQVWTHRRERATARRQAAAVAPRVAPTPPPPTAAPSPAPARAAG